jgi:hypothetical protein
MMDLTMDSVLRNKSLVIIIQINNKWCMGVCIGIE